MRALRGVRSAILGGGLAAATIGCVSDSHPLAGGTAQFLLDESSPIYAVDVLDDFGRPVLPRQEPYEKRVQILMTSEGAAENGAFVDVQITPPGVLQLLPAEDGTCEQLPGVFRCTSGSDGLATFVVRSESDWSGQAELSFVDRSDARSRITVAPAGLPPESLMTLVIAGLDGSRVPATYRKLACDLRPEEENPFEKWEPGRIRVREAEVRATRPSVSPSVIRHAPVIIESQSPEIFITYDPTCAPPRNTRLRVQLNDTGTSPKFFLCFSDLGDAQANILATSGLAREDRRVIDVVSEPRLLELKSETATISPLDGSVPIVDVSAFDADLRNVQFRVDIRSEDPSVLDPAQAFALLPGPDGGGPAQVLARGLQPGTARILVSPELFDEPVCASEPITVTN